MLSIWLSGERLLLNSLVWRAGESVLTEKDVCAGGVLIPASSSISLTAGKSKYNKVTYRTMAPYQWWPHSSNSSSCGYFIFFHKGGFDCHRLKTINFSPTTSQTHCANHISKTPEHWNYDLYVLHCTMWLYTLSHVNGNTASATDHKIISLMTICGLSHFSDLPSWAVRLRESRKNTFSAAKNFTIHPLILKTGVSAFPIELKKLAKVATDRL